MRHSLVLLGVTPLWHVSQWVSRAPPPHTLPAYIHVNLNGANIIRIRKFYMVKGLNFIIAFYELGASGLSIYSGARSDWCKQKQK